MDTDPIRLARVLAPLQVLFGITSDLEERAAGETLPQFLGRTSLFAPLAARELSRLARIVHVRRFRDGETIYQEGRPGAALFILRGGKVEITRRRADGECVTIATLAPPASFEELAAFGSHVVRWTSARSVGPSELLALGRDDLESLGRHAPESANKVIVRLAEVVAGRVRQVLQAQGIEPDPFG